MTSFTVSGYLVTEEIDGISFVSVYCVVTGEVSFATPKLHNLPAEDSSAEFLVKQIKNLGCLEEHGGATNLDVSIELSNVLAIRFRSGENYSRDTIEAIRDLVFDYCEVELILTKYGPLERFGDLKRQVKKLEETLDVLHGKRRTDVDVVYLVSSIYHGTLDALRRRPPDIPPKLNLLNISAWLRVIKNFIHQYEKTFQEAL